MDNSMNALLIKEQQLFIPLYRPTRKSSGAGKFYTSLKKNEQSHFLLCAWALRDHYDNFDIIRNVTTVTVDIEDFNDAFHYWLDNGQRYV